MLNEDLQRLKDILFEVLERKKDEISEDSWRAVTEISKEIQALEQFRR